jgi:hypothetical protein
MRSVVATVAVSAQATLPGSVGPIVYSIPMPDLDFTLHAQSPPGRDSVVADRIDRVARDCEHVARR